MEFEFKEKGIRNMSKREATIFVVFLSYSLKKRERKYKDDTFVPTKKAGCVRSYREYERYVSGAVCFI